MAQGKMKVKAKGKLPAKAKIASVHRGTSNQQKSKVGKKKDKAFSAQQKLQNAVTKEIRKNIEDQARGLANQISGKVDRKKKQT